MMKVKVSRGRIPGSIALGKKGPYVTRNIQNMMNENKIQLNFSCPDEVVKELDKHVDGIRYRSRAQLMTYILAEWLDCQFVRGLNHLERKNKFNSDKPA